MTKEHRNRNAGLHSAYSCSHKNSLNKALGPSELPVPAALRLSSFHGGHPGPPQAPPPFRVLRVLRPAPVPCPQLLPSAAAPEAPPRALRYARGSRRPSAQAAPEQRQAAGPRRHASPSASGGPAVSSATRPGPSAGFRGAGRGGAPRKRVRRWWPRGGGRLGCDPRAVVTGVQGRPLRFLQAARPSAQLWSLVWFPWLREAQLGAVKLFQVFAFDSLCDLRTH